MNGLKHSNNIVKSFFNNSLVSNSSCIMRNVNTILNRINTKFVDFVLMNKYELKKHFENIESEADWRVNFMRELLDIRDNQLKCDLERNATDEILEYISTFR